MQKILINFSCQFSLNVKYAPVHHEEEHQIVVLVLKGQPGSTDENPDSHKCFVAK